MDTGGHENGVDRGTDVHERAQERPSGHAHNPKVEGSNPSPRHHRRCRHGGLGVPRPLRHFRPWHRYGTCSRRARKSVVSWCFPNHHPTQAPSTIRPARGPECQVLDRRARRFVSGNSSGAHTRTGKCVCRPLGSGAGANDFRQRAGAGLVNLVTHRCSGEAAEVSEFSFREMVS